MKLYTLLAYCLINILLISCKKKEILNENTKTCSSENLLETFITPDGEELFIYQNGEAYINNNGICTFALQYFNPNFLDDNYLTNDLGTFIIVNGGDLLPTKSNFVEDFQNYNTFTDLFLKSLADTSLYWTSFTLQSPLAPTVNDYVELRKCILNQTCTFVDNRIDLVADPKNASNQVLKFTSVAPSPEMVTAKSSLSSSLNFYKKDSDMWFEGDFFIESGMPFSLVDFENGFFEQSPGARVVIRNNQLAIENKFGAKLNFPNNTTITVPQKQWFTLKVHFKYSNQNDGIIELWQDGIVLISMTGINLPTSNSIQNELEVGITATPNNCVLLFDNMRISETEF